MASARGQNDLAAPQSTLDERHEGSLRVVLVRPDAVTQRPQQRSQPPRWPSNLVSFLEQFVDAQPHQSWRSILNALTLSHIDTERKAHMSWRQLTAEFASTIKGMKHVSEDMKRVILPKHLVLVITGAYLKVAAADRCKAELLEGLWPAAGVVDGYKPRMTADRRASRGALLAFWLDHLAEGVVYLAYLCGMSSETAILDSPNLEKIFSISRSMTQ